MKDHDLETIPWNCPVCTSCKLIVRGRYGCAGPRQCIAGGPYKGYLSIGGVSEQHAMARSSDTSGET